MCDELVVAYGDPPPMKGEHVGRRPRPRRIEALQGVNVHSVALSDFQACVVTHSGELFTRGKGGDGCLGHGNYEDVPLPRRVQQLWDDSILVVGVSTGLLHTLVAGKDGRVHGVGSLAAMGGPKDGACA